MSGNAIAAAEALGAAIKARSADQVRALYADDIVVWHGSTGVAQDKDENVGLLDGVFTLTSRLQYDDVRRHEIEGGVVQQHRLTGAFADGGPLPGLEACLVIKVNGDGLITRIDEYFDGSHFAEVWERLAALNAK